MAQIQMTGRQLVEIAKKSIGYSVLVTEEGKQYNLTEIQYGRSLSGKRQNKTIMDCLSNGRPARFNSDDLFNVVD